MDHKLKRLDQKWPVEHFSDQMLGQSQQQRIDQWFNDRRNTKLFAKSYDDFAFTSASGHPGQSMPAALKSQGYEEIIARNVERTPVSKFYFGPANMKHVREELCRQVVRKFEKRDPKTKAYISSIVRPEGQSLDTLAIVMKSIYYQHALNDLEMWSKDAEKARASVLKQTAVLNMEVLRDQVPKVYSKVNEYITYQRDKTSQPMPIAHPVSVGTAGTRGNRAPADLMFI